MLSHLRVKSTNCFLRLFLATLREIISNLVWHGMKRSNNKTFPLQSCENIIDLKTTRPIEVRLKVEVIGNLTSSPPKEKEGLHNVGSDRFVSDVS